MKGLSPHIKLLDNHGHLTNHTKPQKDMRNTYRLSPLDPKFKVIFYEDLVDQPERELRSIFEWLELDMPNLVLDRLVDTDGQPHRNQSVKFANKLKSHRVGRTQAHIGPKSTHNQLTSMDSKWREMFEKIINTEDIYAPYR